MANNQLLPFGTAGGANVLDFATYNSGSWRLTGFTAGTAVSQQLNTVWRQSSFAASMLGQFTADYSAQNVNDDGNVGTFETNFVAALNSVIKSALGTQKALFNVQTVTNTTRTTVSGSGGGTFQNALSGTITKQSATSKLAVWVTHPVYMASTGPTQLRFRVGGNSALGVLSPSIASQANGQTALNAIFTGLAAGSLAWDLGYARSDTTAWTATGNPTPTDNAYFPASTVTTIVYGEIEP